MALANDFLRQAQTLAALDPTRPAQINLRRAVSSAYYSAFHLLSQEVVANMVPSTPPALRNRVRRALQHGEMKEVCTQFRRAQIAPGIASLIQVPVSPELRRIAQTFVTLQEERHSADYDPSAVFARFTVLDSVERAAALFAAWRSIRGTAEANVFLAALAFGRRWDR